MKKVKPLPTSERLNELFEYRDGKLINKAENWGRLVKGAEAGSLQSRGYTEVKVDGIRYQAHRIIWKMLKGKDPEQVIDHINGDKRDNRIENLRDVCQGVNCFNVKAKGVYYQKDKNKWRTQLRFLGKLYHLGYFNTKEEAKEVHTAFKTAYSYVG